MADYIHLVNETSAPVAWSILSNRNAKWSNSPFELLVDQIFNIIEGKLIDSHDNLLQLMGNKVIPPSHHIAEETASILNRIGGQSMYSTVSLLNLKNGAYASWTSHTNQSWIVREDRIYPSVFGNINRVQEDLRSIGWRDIEISDAAQATIKKIVERSSKALP